MNTEKNGFINVYNFIPLGKEKSESYNDTDEHTGVIEYEIETLTPLFIPNTSNADVYGKEDTDRKTDFFSYDKLEGKTNFEEYHTPVLPGSELRGMVRSTYEAITNSCMNILNTEVRPVKRTGEVFKAALIQKSKGNQYTLIGAEDCIYREEKKGKRQYNNAWQTTKFKEGQCVFFNEIKRQRAKSLIEEISSERDEEHPHHGYLIKGEESPDGKNCKHNAHVFMKKNKVITELTRLNLDGLDLVLRSYQEQPGQEKHYEEYRKAYKTFLEKTIEGYFPVYYSAIENKDKQIQLLYLAPAAITKEISNHTIGDLIKGYLPCKETEKCCPACDLFGMVGMDNEQSQASKVRFSDAFVRDSKPDKEYYDRPQLLPELSSPKLGNTEFYLKKPEGANFWTYDYYLDGQGNLVIQKPELMGRKFYWNQPDMVYPENVKASKRNQTIRPVKRGVTFCGRVFFDKISEKQLQQLVWILNCGTRKSREDDIAYKLGGGKPLGLGSVKLTVKSIKERELSVKENIVQYMNSLLSIDEELVSYGENGFDSHCKDEFFNLVSYEKMRGYTIAYPMTEEQKEDYDKNHMIEEGYLWFTKNHLVYRDGTVAKKMSQKRTEYYVQNALSPANSIEVLPFERRTYDAQNIRCGTVTEHTSDGKKVRVHADGTKDIWLHVSVFAKKLKRNNIDLRKEFPIGTIISYKYEGKDDKGYDVYKIISISNNNVCC